MSGKVIKVILIGDSMVGKTQLACRFAEGEFSEEAMATIGVDFKVREITVDSEKYKLQVWDTGGQERYRTFIQSCYRRARGVLIVFDWARQDSFNHLTRWFELAYEAIEKDTIPLVLVGNKEDLEHQVSDDQAKAFAEEYQVELLSASAKTGNGVNEVFQKVAEMAVKDLKAKVAAPGPDFGRLLKGTKRANESFD
jgi:small GTP-binding protein